MRVRMLLLVLTFGLGSNTCGHGTLDVSSKSSNGPTSVSTSEPETPAVLTVVSKVARVDFNTQVRPILEARCQPCHFAGGKVYEHLPFDRPATITTLGTKLFTRIKDENERRLIREFLSQQSAAHYSDR